MKRYLLVFFILMVSLQVFGQTVTEPKKYWIYFTDKKASVYSVTDPLAFLSQKSIDRRNRFHIPVTEQDLPVNDPYITQIKNTGAEIVITSRWMNAVSVNIFSDDQLIAISELPCVKQITAVKKYRAPLDHITTPYEIPARMNESSTATYGAAENQFTMIHGDFLHDNGFRGQGITIAVLDGGFFGVDSGFGYQSEREKGQILGVHNFPDDNDSVYLNGVLHGTWVFGIMASDIPGIYVGSAPDAEYYLFRTEVVDSERVQEEDYWQAGAEAADIVGADIINSSLGYTNFDDPSEDHTYADMDGNTTVCTIAADIAASKGILVCNSAGNEGANTWHYISAPADGDSVFAIGAVHSDGTYTSFSSQGPTSDGRIKPNIAVQGNEFPIVNPDGSVGFGGGTSFASPLAAGTTACLWQAFPEKTNMEIMNAIQRSASQFNNPDNFLGYGIPNYEFAYHILAGLPVAETENYFYVIDYTDNNEIVLALTSAINIDAQLNIFDAAGRQIENFYLQPDDGYLNAMIKITPSTQLAKGIYFVNLASEEFSQTRKIFIK